MTSERNLRSVKISVTVSEDVRAVSEKTPETHAYLAASRPRWRPHQPPLRHRAGVHRATGRVTGRSTQLRDCISQQVEPLYRQLDR